MNSVVIDIEDDGRDLDDNLVGFSHRLLHFFTGPEFCADDYADLFLMYVGEDDGCRIPQGLIRGCQNTCRRPLDVMLWGLQYLYSRLKAARPNYSEHEFGEYLDAFLTDETGYAGRRIAQRAQAAPYYGRIARARRPESEGPHRDEGIQPAGEPARGK